VIRIALACALLGGCLSKAAVDCGNGNVCPSGTVCVGGGDICATPPQIAACDGLADRDMCVYGTTIGTCDRGACVSSGCGNGVVEGSEACDDGNTMGGDGCSADCSKVEMCGDAIVDVGEACDDGNTNPVDGCDACTATAWTATAIVGANAPASTAQFALPIKAVVDSRGNMFVSDENANRVWRIDSGGIVSIAAGNGTQGFSGDGGAASAAQLTQPWGIAVDGLDNLYIVDSGNKRVRRVDPQGIITTIAGGGNSGVRGDNGPATAAYLSIPYGIAVDGTGNLYIADENDYRIRKVDVNGQISTFAGGGGGGDDGPATSAFLDQPTDVLIDSVGNVFIAEANAHKIRKVDPAGTITTIAGKGTWSSISGYGDGGPALAAELRYPWGIAIDTMADRLYIADSNDQRIRVVDLGSGTITTLAGDGTNNYSGDGGPAAAAQLFSPFGVAVDATGAVLICDSSNQRVRKVVAGTITSVAGAGTLVAAGDGRFATDAPLVAPYSIAIDSAGNRYIADSRRVRRVGLDGVITTVAGNGTLGTGGDGGPALASSFNSLHGLAIDSSDNLFVIDDQRVRRIDHTTGVIATVSFFAGLIVTTL